MAHREIHHCRLCRAERLTTLLELGEQYLTGVFPRSPDQRLSRGPLTLARCTRCGLVQLRHSYALAELYGPNYGYRSGLNAAMVAHLKAKVKSLRRRVQLEDGDVVLDIGSNDGTTLGFLPPGCRRVGFDPSAEQFRRHYPSGVSLVTDFFSAERFRAELGRDARARLVTAIAMFYDLEDPLGFVAEVESILADDGVWHFEQSYLPAMLETTAYDTICHEHLEYYAVRQIKWMTDRAGLKIIDIAVNDVNGGSFAVTAAKRDAPYPEDTASIDRFLEQESQLGLDGDAPYQAFRERVFDHRDKLIERLAQLRDEGRRVFGYGASTKGNVILQYCGIDAALLPCIAEVNERKFGCYTPGTNIPIVSEAEARARKVDVFLVLPWHFRANLVQRERAFLRAGGRMLFPLPRIEEIGA